MKTACASSGDILLLIVHKDNIFLFATIVQQGKVARIRLGNNLLALIINKNEIIEKCKHITERYVSRMFYFVTRMAFIEQVIQIASTNIGCHAKRVAFGFQQLQD